jgi:hypothetical protein
LRYGFAYFEIFSQLLRLKLALTALTASRSELLTAMVEIDVLSEGLGSKEQMLRQAIELYPQNTTAVNLLLEHLRRVNPEQVTFSLLFLSLFPVRYTIFFFLMIFRHYVRQKSICSSTHATKTRC